MVDEPSNESGQKTFRPDLQRGKWEKSTDYLFASIGLALKLDSFVISYAFGMIPLTICMIVYLVPILVIHSFMGQFSSSGPISAFRLAPFFKGMGYVSIFLSVSMLIFYSIFAAIPLIFIIGSFRPTLPWNCEDIADWGNVTHYPTTFCNESSTILMGLAEEQEKFPATIENVPSVIYFIRYTPPYNSLQYDIDDDDFKLSWYLVALFIVVWSLIALVFYKFSDTAKFGKFIHYMVISTVILLFLCFARFLFLPGALDGFNYYIAFQWDLMHYGMLPTAVNLLQSLGAGWGSIIALSSFNELKTNIINYSWIIGFGQIFIYIMFSIVTFMLDHYYLEKFENYKISENPWGLLTSASALATMEWPNFWTILYYLMFFLATLITMTTQIFTIVKTLFDEFEGLRLHKQKVTFGLIGGLAACSFIFCTLHGIKNFSVLIWDGIISHSILHLVLLLVVLWIYGRERFQRDIKFMVGQTFTSWKINLLRFIAPFLIILFLLIGIFVPSDSSNVLRIISTILVLIPLLCIPGYGFYLMRQGSGTFCERFRKACRPTDWYPLETEHRQQYEEALGTSHQLYEVTGGVN